jgi:hypothetical protein
VNAAKPRAIAIAMLLGSLSANAHAESAYVRQRYFPRRTLDIVAHAGAAVLPPSPYQTGVVASGTLFLRLSPMWGGVSVALDAVRRERESGPGRSEFLLYVSHRVAYTKLARVEPWLEPVGIGLGFYRPAVGIDVLVIPDLRLGCAAKLPIFLSPTRSTFGIGLELTAGLTIAVGSAQSGK